MGIKTEIQLFVVYNQAKDRILKEVQAIISTIDQGLFIQPPKEDQPCSK